MHYPRDIQLFLRNVVDDIKEVLNPEFIILSGSFGKNSWLYSDNKLISDFEIVFVCEKKWSFKRKRKLLESLNKDYPFDISLKGYIRSKIENGVISNYASKNPGYLSLDFYDTFSEPTILYSRNRKNLVIKCEPKEIAIWEAWRLYANRMAELMDVEYSNNLTQNNLNYALLKIFEATADSYCIVNQIYKKNILDRINVFTEEIIEKDFSLSDECKKSFPLIYMSLQARHNHNLSFFEVHKTNINELKKIMNSWMNYFEIKLSEYEKISTNGMKTFHIDYLNNLRLQRKYYGFNYRFNIVVSNLIRLIGNKKLLNLDFKFYNFNISWRHVILLCISSVFNERNEISNKFTRSKLVANKLLRKRSIHNLKNEDFILIILSYWKTLR